MDDNDASDDDSAPVEAVYGPYTPFITHLKHRGGTEPEYLPVHDGEIGQFGPHFRIPGRRRTDRCRIADADVLS
jgi:hypothetical protein